MVKRKLIRNKTTEYRRKKIVFIQTNYPDFLVEFYKANPNWPKWNYPKTKKKLLDELFGSADFYGKSLYRLGWAYDELIINDFNQQSKWAKANGVNVKSEPFWTKYIPGSLRNLLGLNGWAKKIAFAQIQKIKPDVLYIHDLNIFNSTDLIRFKRSGIRIIGQIAYPLPIDMRPLKEYDLIISSFHHYVELFRSMGIKSEYLRWCFEKSILNRIKVPGRKKYDVSFVGGFSPHHKEGNRMFEKLAREIKVDFWGYGVNYLMPNSPIKKRFHGLAFGKKMYEVFADSKIVINRHIGVAKKSANNMRMFEATGMGALLLTDHKSNMNEFFDTNREVVTYKSSKDLISKVKKYLKDDKARKIIAKRGQARTIRDHTYEVRMKELDSILKKIL